MSQASGHPDDLLCPSAQPDIAGGVAFGVVAREGGRPRVTWIEDPVPVTSDLLALTGEVPPTQVFRIAAPCQEGACQHFDGARCGLALQLVEALDGDPGKPPPCKLRPQCRWFQQEGVAACRRCSQIVTAYDDPGATLAAAARPRHGAEAGSCGRSSGAR